MDPDLKKLSDSMTVMEAFQRQHDQAIKDHKEWLQSHDQAFARHAMAMQEADEKINILIQTQQELTEQQKALTEQQKATAASLQAFLDSMRKAGNGDR